MDTVGILPAAGLCSRWNGTYKELLPTWENAWVIDSSIDDMKVAGVRDFVIVSSPNKIQTHVQHFSKNKYKDLNISFVIQYYPAGLYDAIKLALVASRKYDRFIFTMPDTILGGIPCSLASNILERYSGKINFVLGIFPTDEPQNFGILKSYNADSTTAKYIEFEIIDKPDADEILDCKKWYSFFDNKYHYVAWGMSAWTGEFTDFVLNSPEITSIGDAFNEYNKINKRKCLSSLMTRYVDLASWNDYALWMRENTQWMVENTN